MAILIFLIILIILILSHEFGHFLFAKLNRVKVEEFGFGFPPKIFWFKKGETIYSFNLFPIGGFVKILGEDAVPSDKDNVDASKNFAFKPVYIRAVIISSGVLFNLILAWILLSVNFAAGMPTQINDESAALDPQIVVTEVIGNSPAKKAGLAPGDRINGFQEIGPVSTVSEIQKFIREHKGEEITVLYSRNGKDFSATIVPRPDPPEGEGSLGIAMARVGIVKSPWHLSLWLGLKETVFLTAFIAQAFFYLITGLFKGVGFDQIAGPLGIFSVVSGISQMGFIYLVRFAAILSINLAILNIIPFPGLDGGRLLFLAIEKIKGSPVNYKIANFVHGLGFAFLIIMLILITYNDFLRF
jgi:regulator of sigma E protease